MTNSQFSALLPIILADFADHLSAERGISTDEAFVKIYASKLFSFLSDEKTKVWNFSTQALLAFLHMEETTGEIVFPEC